VTDVVQEGLKSVAASEFELRPSTFVQTDNLFKTRLHEFSMTHGATPEENQAIQDALRGLNRLREDVAAWRSKQAVEDTNRG
jgi:hypothetical protein